MPKASTLRELMRIRAHNRAVLDSINANLGTALGFKKPTDGDLTDEPAVIVFVERKINPKWLPGSQLLPKKLEGPDGLSCPLDVVEGSSAVEEEDVEPSHSELAERLRGWDEKVWAGSQVSHWVSSEPGKYSIGTLGAFARHRQTEELGFLTNQHVGIAAGKRIYHPVPWGVQLGTTLETLEYAPDEAWYGPLVDEPRTFVRVDCAFVSLRPDFPRSDLDPRLMGVGQLGDVETISLDDMSIIGRDVLRVGRTTGLRRGTVVAFGYEFADEDDVTGYTDLLVVGKDGKAFSTHGDSGSLIVTDDPEHRPIGLLWGGWQKKLRTGYAQEKWTYGIARSRVLDARNIDQVKAL